MTNYVLFRSHGSRSFCLALSPPQLTFRIRLSTFYLTMNKTVTSASEVLAAGRSLAEKGYVAGSDGNLSMRLTPDQILITPSGANKGALSESDLITVDNSGAVLSGTGRPSSEMPMHLFVYQHRGEITACVHSHPPYVTAHAVAGVRLEPDVLPEVVLFVGPVALTEFAPPGTEAVGDSLAPYIADHNAFVLRNHGLLTVGRTMREALDRHVTVEHFARISFLARQLGGMTRLPAEEVLRLDKLRQSLANAGSVEHKEDR